MQDIQCVTAQHQETEEKAKKPSYPLLHKVAIAGGICLLVTIVCLIEKVGSIGYFLVFAATLIAFNHGAGLLNKLHQMYQHEVVPFLPNRQSSSLLVEGERRQIEKPLTTTTRQIDEEIEPSAPSSTTTVRLNDHGERDELLHLGAVAETREPVVAHANRFFGKGIFVAGIQESGKTNLGALLAEQMGKCYIPSVIFDLKQEYASLVQVVPNGIQAGLGFDTPGSFNLSVENAAEFAALVMESGFQAIIDLQSYATPDAMGMIIAAIVNGLMAWSRNEADTDRSPCFIFLDEAHHFLPERVNMTQVSKEVSTTLQQSFFQVVNMGRSYGYTMAFFTQRIANIAKWTIANCQIKVIMRHSLDRDLDRCEEEVKKDVATREMIEQMPQGHGVVSGLAEQQLIVHFALRKSYHASHTPDIQRAHRRYRDGGTKTAVLPTEMEDLRANPLRTAPQLKLVEKPVATIGQLNQHALPAHLQETLEILTQESIPLSDLAKRLGVSKTTAHRYVEELKARRKLGTVERSIEQ